MSFCSRGLRLKSQTCWPRICRRVDRRAKLPLAFHLSRRTETIWQGVGASPRAADDLFGGDKEATQEVGSTVAGGRRLTPAQMAAVAAYLNYLE